VFNQNTLEVHVNVRGEVACSEDGPYHSVQSASAEQLPQGTHNIANLDQLHGEIGEQVAITFASGPSDGPTSAEFSNPNDRGDSLWFGTVLLFFKMTHLGEQHSCAYIHYFQHVEPDNLPFTPHTNFPCFRRATDADGGGYGVVLVEHLLWMAPMVPDIRDPAWFRLNVDAWL
jgi:hypothetical protein